MTYAERFSHFLDLAQPRHIEAGKMWYSDAKRFCERVAESCGVSSYKVAGVLAALSPATFWERNKIEARAFVRAYVTKTEPETTISCYLRQVRKADTIMSLSDACSILEVGAVLGPRAFKTKAFFHNILVPESNLFITIDRHMLVAADAKLTAGLASKYRMLEAAVLTAAQKHGLQGPEAQAIIWLVVKDIVDGVLVEEPPF